MDEDMEIMSRGAPAPKETPAQEIRKAMKNDDDPDFMAKQVPLLDVMRKLQNLESAFPKIKKMESVVEKSSVNLAEINMKMRTVVNLDHFNEKFDELTLQLRRQYQKDVELYEEKTKDFLKAKLDVTEFNKRMSSKVNTYDFDRLNSRVQDLERVIKLTVSTLIEGQRKEFKKALEQKASLDVVEDLLSKKADLSRVESIGERVDHLETQVNHMRLEEVDDESEEVLDSEEEEDYFDEEALQVPEQQQSKPNFPGTQSSDPFMGGSGGALQKKPEEQKKGEEKKGEEKKDGAKTEEVKKSQDKEGADKSQEKKDDAPKVEKVQPPQEKKEEPPKPAEQPPKPADKPGQLTVDAVKKLDADTGDLQQEKSEQLRSKKTKSKATKSQVSSMRGGSRFLMKHMQNQINLAHQKIQELDQKKDALQKELNETKDELRVVNKRSLQNKETVEIIKVLLEEIKQQNNDILEYTDYAKKQHSELLVLVNKNEVIVKVAERELRRFIQTTKKDNESRLRRIVVLEAHTNKLLKDFDIFKNYRRKRFEELTAQIFSMQDSKMRLEKNFGQFLTRVTLLLNKQNEDKDKMSGEIKDLKIPLQEELEKMRKENETLLRELHRNQAVNRDLFTDYQKMMADTVEINITGDGLGGKRRASREDSLMVTPSLATNTFFPKMHSVDYHEDSSIGNFHDVSISSVGKHRYNQSVGGVGISNVSKRAYRTDYKTSSVTPGRIAGKMMTTAIGFGERKQPGGFELPPVGKETRRTSAKVEKKPNISAIVNLNPFDGKNSAIEPTGKLGFTVDSMKNFIANLTISPKTKTIESRLKLGQELPVETASESNVSFTEGNEKGKKAPLQKKHKKILMQKMKK